MSDNKQNRIVSKCCIRCNANREATSILNPYGITIYYCAFPKCRCHTPQVKEEVEKPKDGCSYCNNCFLETTPLHKCKCPERNYINGSWDKVKEKEPIQEKILTQHDVECTGCGGANCTKQEKKCKLCNAIEYGACSCGWSKLPPKLREWEERFDKQFGVQGTTDYWKDFAKEIKSFISKVEQQAREEEREKVRKETMENIHDIIWNKDGSLKSHEISRIVSSVMHYFIR